MKRLLLLLIAGCGVALAQPSINPIRYVIADPTGTACPATAIALRTPLGNIYTCVSGVYALTSTGGGGGSTGGTCGVTQSATTISIFATASATAPCLIPTGATTVRSFTAPILVTLPSGSDTWYAGVLPAGTVAVGANSATATCAGCAGGVTQTGITSVAGLDPYAVSLASFASVSTAFTTITPLEGSIPGSFPLTAGTGMTLTNSGAAVTVTLNNTAVAPAAYALANITVDAQGRLTAAANGTVSPALTGVPTAPTAASTDNSTTIATTAYVTTGITNAINAAAGRDLVKAATAAVLPNTPTYNNGVSGVGATLTSASNTALVVDGYTCVITDRILVKNQASSLQNGIYYCSQVGTGILPWILTRALDYDVPSDINNTIVPVANNGTVNPLTSWIQTATVATVGTDAITFAAFTPNGANIVTASSPGAGLCHFAGATQACTSSAVVNADIANGTIDLTTKVTGILPVANGGVVAPYADFTSTSSATGAGSQTLKSYTIPANSLSANNKYVRIHAVAYCAATTGAISISFGATTITSMPNCSATGTGQSINITCTVGRTGASAESGDCSVIYQSNSATYPYLAAPAEDTTATIVVALKVTNGANTAGDWVARVLTVEFGN